MVHQEPITFDTTGHRHMADLTDQVAVIVGRSGVETGIVQVFCVGCSRAAGGLCKDCKSLCGLTGGRPPP